MRVLYIDAACIAFAEPKRETHWQPHCVRIAAILEGDPAYMPRRMMCHLIHPEPSWGLISHATLPYHKADRIDFEEAGISVTVAAHELAEMMSGVDQIVAHNAKFHHKVTRSLFVDSGDFIPGPVDIPWYCTMAASMPVLKLPTKNSAGYKQPKLPEAFQHFVGVQMPAHPTWYPFGVTNVRAVSLIHKALTSQPATTEEGDELIHG